MRAPRLWLATGLLVAGLVGVGEAGWIHAKAVAAQWLLERAWLRAQESGSSLEAKPWPWADTEPVAELTVPRLDHRVLVLAGASGRTLAFGPGHVTGSAGPGTYGNAVLTGHRDTHFSFLRELVVGDAVKIRGREGHESIYRVLSGAVVHVDDLELHREADGRELTLVTCFPFDAIRPGGPLRYVVRAAVDGSHG